jgi:deoxyribodipyrimidine photo-lyase
MKELDSRFEGIRQHNPELLNAYINGTTGFPFLDACMRSLQQTGWINFKQRAMLATFGCNVLLLDWRVVGNVLAHAFIDYDPGIHWKQMQLQSGIDPKHHIPMHNVIKQGKENDPKGEFIKLYIPELRHLDDTNIHEPWSLEINPYITPIIDLKQSMDDHKKLLYGIKKNGHTSE